MNFFEIFQVYNVKNIKWKGNVMSVKKNLVISFILFSSISHALATNQDDFICMDEYYASLVSHPEAPIIAVPLLPTPVPDDE